MRYRVRLAVDDDQDIYHASKLYVGLCALAEREWVDLSVTARLRRGRRLVPVAHLVPCLEVRPAHGGDTRLIAFDLYDRSDRFAWALLDLCDVYFKRNYFEPDLSRLPAPVRCKVRPFGLNYPCLSPAVLTRVLPRALFELGGRLLREPAAMRSWLSQKRRQLKSFLTLPDFRQFERPSDVPAEPVVTFQPRVWAPEETEEEDLPRLNEQRVEIVRALRTSLGPRFQGGLVPTAYARAMYPDAITDRPAFQRTYVRQTRQCLVAVYTRGLHHSTAFKLPECLAGSLCLVSEPVRNTNPAPLVEGTHYLGFETPAECVAQCRRLLEDPARAAAMRAANSRYYRDEVEPPRHLWNCLERALHD